jgi:hypothetical protein
MPGLPEYLPFVDLDVPSWRASISRELSHRERGGSRWTASDTTIVNPNRVIVSGPGYTGDDGLSKMPSYGA